MLSRERVRGLIVDLERMANALSDGDSCSLSNDECASICADIAAEFRAVTRDPTVLLSCPECGCTDVQVTAWVDANTGEPTNDESPAEYAFCPQCDDSELRDRDLIPVTKPQPFVAEVVS